MILLVVLNAVLAASSAVGANGAASLPAINLHYGRGEAYYLQGQYGQAIEEYEKAYQLKPLPRLLVRIGDAHSSLGNTRDALTCYLRFQQQEPMTDPAISRAVAERIRRLRSILDATTRAPINASSSLADKSTLLEPIAKIPRPEVRAKPVYRRWTLWVPISLAAAGIIGITLGATLGHDNPLDGLPGHPIMMVPGK